MNQKTEFLHPLEITPTDSNREILMKIVRAFGYDRESATAMIGELRALAASGERRACLADLLAEQESMDADDYIMDTQDCFEVIALRGIYAKYGPMTREQAVARLKLEEAQAKVAEADAKQQSGKGVS